MIRDDTTRTTARTAHGWATVAVTKLAPPKYSRQLVARDDILRALSRDRERTLTLVVAPAGFGKTTLLALWRRELISNGCAVAWLALEPADDEETTLVAALVASLRHSGLSVGGATLDVANRAGRHNPELISSVLCNELGGRTDEIYLVLDDFHHVQDTRVLRIFQHLADHAPANVHLVIAARAWPELRLVQLQLREQVNRVELRHLRFSVDETRIFLADRLDDSTPDTLYALHRMTDGWVAGLQLAVIGMRNRGAADTEGTPPVGTSIADYLAEDVLDGLAPATLTFLLQVSICDRFNAELCRALTGLDTAAAELRRAEKDNLFVLPLEDAEDWYCFHPMFADYLRKRLRRRVDLDITQLHRRACHWFRGAGHLIEATRHALEAGDTDCALQLVAQSSRALVELGHYRNLLQWVERLPRAAVLQNTTLLTNAAFANAMCFRFSDAEVLLRSIDDRGLSTGDFAPEVVQSIIELFRDQTEQVLRHLPAWLAAAESADSLQVCAACNVLTCAYTHVAEFQKAREVQLLTRRWRDEERTPAELVYSKCVTGLTYAMAGDMRQADGHYRDALTYAERKVGRHSLPASFAAALYAEVLYESDRLDSVDAILADRLDIVVEGAIPDALIRAFVSFARTRCARGDLDGGLRALERLQTRAFSLSLKRPQAVAMAERIRVMLLRGDIDAARTLLAGLDTLVRFDADACNATRLTVPEIDMARARIALASGEPQQALDALGTTIADAEAQGRLLAAVRLRILGAMALYRLGRRTAAESCLHEAVRAGSQLGLLRAFVDESGAGDLVRALFNRHRARADGVPDSFPDRILAPCVHAGAGLEQVAALRPAADPVPADLRERECEILTLLSRGFSNKKIALTLNLSAETVKWYLKQIYPKLGVSCRTQAVDQARARRLI